MENSDREELLWRRVADKVSESVDKQIKGRYFWIATIFAVVSLFGGSALISLFVQRQVSSEMLPVHDNVLEAKFNAEATNKGLHEARQMV